MDSLPTLYIGLMSGTSLDSIDAALVDLDSKKVKILGTVEYAIPDTLRHELMHLCLPGNNEIDRMGVADRQLGKVFAEAVNSLLKQQTLKPQHINAIGSHGQTIRHRPEGTHGFTLQIADPNTIAHDTGITTIADFRRRDVAAGGQGAPLAPAFHQAAFSHKSRNRAVVNIGGMANITFLSSNGECSGFDTGPGNVLMDSWIQSHTQQKYDRDGQWAKSGHISPSLLANLLEHPFLERKPPKSTGREDFNFSWLQQQVEHFNEKPEDVQATLLEFTALSITQAIGKLPEVVNEVYICGGGAFNTQLMLRLETLLNPTILASTTALGVPAQWVEAAAFAWLAQQTMMGLKGNIPGVTGATTEEILGAIYPATPFT